MPSKKHILIAEDDRSTCHLMAETLRKKGFSVATCSDGLGALKHIESGPVDLVIADYQMPEMDGMELMQAVQNAGHIIPFIIVSAHGSMDYTLQALELGASEYLTKPVDPKALIFETRKALNIGNLQREMNYLRKEVQEKYRYDRIIGKSPAMRQVYEYIHKASSNAGNVLITGESGTGKELTARAIHYSGLRKQGPFIAVNCSVFSQGTLESELFGHVKGAFTDAVKDRKGRFELADKGTLFIDEIGDLPLEVQVKLLRVIQEKKLERVGGEQTLSTDFRLITATNHDLNELIREGRFREDLFYRLNVIHIQMPPLRKRREDVPDLLKYFLKLYNQAYHKDIKTFSIEALKLLKEYPWPGNVRQLENTVESAVALCDGETIQMADLPMDMALPPFGEAPAGGEAPSGATLPEAVETLEKRMIRDALVAHDGVKSRAAKALGINERVLSYKMTKYGILPN